MGRCLAPCSGRVSEAEYAEVLAQARVLLEGKRKDLLRQLQEQMKEAASNLDYERAAKIRDQISSLNKALEEQRVISSGREDLDVFGLAFRGKAASVQGFTFREGRLLGRESFLFRGVEEKERESLLSSFLQQFYSGRSSIPRILLLPFEIPEEILLGDWLSEKKGQKVRVEVPIRGKKLGLLRMALANAEQGLEGILPSSARLEEEARGLQTILSLANAPQRIEAYDISNISGTQAVGSMVVWENGVWNKESYRRFKIKTIAGANDVGMIEEVLRRRLRKWQEMALPDLILLDGGRGQLAAGLKAQREEGLSQPLMIALAKAEEEIWLPGERTPVRLPPDSPALHLLQRIRDEAHRFALSYHRLLRRKGALYSWLDEIPGVGSKRKKALLNHFGNRERLRAASLAELQAVPGISAALARIIFRSLRSFPPEAHAGRSGSKAKRE
jgi:excinuclease ABC subunit C